MIPLLQVFVSEQIPVLLVPALLAFSYSVVTFFVPDE